MKPRTMREAKQKGGTTVSTRKEFQVGKRKFVARVNDGGCSVTSINPYDETEYHWASKPLTSDRWEIIRDRKVLKSVAGTLSVEEVGRLLNQMDKDAKLSRT